MTVIMALGTGWRFLKPAGLTAEQTREVLTTVTYYLFLPALVIEVLWQADIGIQSLGFTALGMVAVISGMCLAWLMCKLFHLSDSRTGAIILASAFPNVTYLGLPVLEQTFGFWARSVVIQLDYFAASPLLFTLGVLVARHYGREQHKPKFILSFLNTPPFWAAFVAVLLNTYHVPSPAWLMGTLQKMSAVVVPIMLFSLGLALNWSSIRLKNSPYVLPVVLVRMLLVPTLLFWIIDWFPIADKEKAAAVLDLSMPSMVLGIVFCDRYKLDSGLYAMAVTVTTLLSLISLPFWYAHL
jgi:predicted permease